MIISGNLNPVYKMRDKRRVFCRTHVGVDWKGCAVITKELCLDPGIGGVAEAAREALTERTVWKTRFWEIL